MGGAAADDESGLAARSLREILFNRFSVFPDAAIEIGAMTFADGFMGAPAVGLATFAIFFLPSARPKRRLQVLLFRLALRQELIEAIA